LEVTLQHAEWWYDDSGNNLLKGVEDDPDNPISLHSDYIVDFLSTIPAAVDSFNRVVPNMLPEEQDRLWPLLEGIPKYTYQDPKTFNDTVQNNWNRSGVRLEKPKGRG